MVIWIVFIAVDYDVDRYTHYTPQPGAAIPTESCGSLAGVGRAQLRSAVPIATDATWQVVELAAYLEPIGKLIMPGSRVRVPPFPPKSMSSH
jgi:hypothetical protein